MANSHTHPTFMSLPAEIRLQIYNFVPHYPAFPIYSNLLSVCRQVRTEGLAQALGRLRAFCSWQHLFLWTSRGNPSYLPFVKIVRVLCHGEVPGLAKELENRTAASGLINTDFSTQLRAQSAREREAASGKFEPVGLYNTWLPKYLDSLPFQQSQGGLSPAENPDSEERCEKTVTISSLWETLLKLPGLRDLGLLFTADDFYHLSADQELVLEIAAHACQGLQLLSFSSPIVSLDFLGNLHRLRAISFSGYTKSSPEKTLAILRKLPCLETIRIYGYGFIPRTVYWEGPSKYFSFTPKVLCGLRPLTCFGLGYIEPRLNNSAIITPEMMAALLTHKDTLRDFAILTNYQCDVAAFEKILEVISTAPLQRLRLRMWLPPGYKVADVRSRIPKSLFRASLDLWESSERIAGPEEQA